MTKQEAKIRIEKLKKEINHHRYLYHVLDKPVISDAALDSLKHELWQLEQEYPDLVTPDSPTQRVGGKVLSEFKKVKHVRPILSIEDAFSFEEVTDWEERNERLIKEKIKGYYCEPKMDGLAIMLRYDEGVLTAGVTRGDGGTGENVTHTIRTIESIPLNLEEKGLTGLPKTLWVRGEVVITKEEFKKINQKIKKAGGKEFANPRNLAAGTIRQLEPKIAAERKMTYYAFEILTDMGQKTHAEVHEYLKKFGFKTSDLCLATEDLSGVERAYKKIETRRDKLPYEIDGIVVVVNDIKQERALGSIGKADRWMLAYKYEGEQATTILEDIKVQIGRTGVLTPVAILKPVRVRGVTVTHATLHNEDQIKRLGVKIGDTVIVERAGDVIPAVIGVLSKLRTGRERTFHMPGKCPVCSHVVTKQKTADKKQDETVAYFCKNKKCYAQQRERLLHFTRRGAFDLEGLGDKIIDRFLEDGLISDPASIFELKKEDIALLERFGEKSAENIIKMVASRRHIELPRFLFALGIRHIGEETGRVLSAWLADQKKDLTTPHHLLELFEKTNVEELQNVSDIGPVVARSILDWFSDRENQKIVSRLHDVGVRLQPSKLQITNYKLQGLTFVFTGELEGITRDEAKNLVREHGGDVLESVSRQTSYLVVGHEPGSKYKKAKNLGTKILNESELKKLIK